MIAVIINGICGQMGRAVYAACNASNDAFLVVAGVDSHFEGANPFSCPVVTNIADVKARADVIIDFSVPVALPDVLRYAQRMRIPAVIGTTGLSEMDHRLIRTASAHIPVFQTGNMSLGVNLQLELARTAAATLGSDFDVEIIETHHRKKIDAPSGTALMLADAVRSQFPEPYEYVYGRHEKNKRRTDAEIGIHSIRGGTVVGEHEVQFIGNDEIIGITHRAFSKQVFVRGALRAAQYLIGREPGLFSMANIVTEHDVASHLYMLEGQAVITVSGLADGAVGCGELFSQIAAQGVNLDMIAVSFPHGGQGEIGFSLAQAQFNGALNALRPLSARFPEMTVNTRADVVKCTVEGTGMALRHGVAARLFTLLADAGVHVHLITTSETKIEFCVDAVDAGKTVEELQGKLLSDLC